MYTMFFNFCLLILLCERFSQNEAYREMRVNGVDTVLAVENEVIEIECHKDIPMAYCVFQHPNGTRFSITGQKIKDGHCSITLKVTSLDSGKWKCHIGSKSVGREIRLEKVLHVADRFVAITPLVRVSLGGAVTLACLTTKSMLPLNYCRFESPTEFTLSLNSKITAENPVMGRYYYPQDMSVDRGDCAVVVKNVQISDHGDWMCGAGLDDDGREYVDYISLEVKEFYKDDDEMSSASTTSITLGVCAAVITLGGLAYYIWKKRCPPPSENIELQEIGPPQRRDIPQITVESPSTGPHPSPSVAPAEQSHQSLHL